MDIEEKKKLKVALIDEKGREINNPVPKIVVPDILKPPTLSQQIEKLTRSDAILIKQAIHQMDIEDKEAILDLFDDDSNRLTPYEFYDYMVHERLEDVFGDRYLDAVERHKPDVTPTDSQEEPVSE